MMKILYFRAISKFSFITLTKYHVFTKQHNSQISCPKMSIDKYEEIENSQEKNAADKIQRMKKAEKFIEVDEGKFECQGCGYIYDPSKGDKFAGISPNVRFSELSSDFNCPACKSSKSQFKGIKKVIIGFAENQKYGLGGNSMTSDQKNLAIFGTLVAIFFLLLSGYFLE